MVAVLPIFANSDCRICARSVYSCCNPPVAYVMSILRSPHAGPGDKRLRLVQVVAVQAILGGLRRWRLRRPWQVLGCADESVQHGVGTALAVGHLRECLTELLAVG